MEEDERPDREAEEEWVVELAYVENYGPTTFWGRCSCQIRERHWVRPGQFRTSTQDRQEPVRSTGRTGLIMYVVGYKYVCVCVYIWKYWQGEGGRQEPKLG